jgi:Na+(H+)/acetate symporter ActP
MNFLKSLFSENGDVSMMRVLALLSLLIGAYLAISGKDTSVTVFVTAAFGGKFLQKAVEK